MKTFEQHLAEELTGKPLQDAVFGKKPGKGSKAKPSDVAFHLPGVGRFPSKEFAQKHYPDHEAFKK